MALGKWTNEKQKDLFIAATDMPRSPGHPFYVALNKLLVEAKFDAYVEGLCEPHYREGGRPGVPSGVFFRMLFVGYFEGIDSQRGIAWRCSATACRCTASSGCCRPRRAPTTRA